MQVQAYKEAMLKLAARYKELKKRLNVMGTEPWNWPIATHPLFVAYTTKVLDTDPTPENLEEVISGINRLILAIDGEISVTAFPV
jgi:hypothetical protein